MFNKFLIIVLATLSLNITPKIVMAENSTISKLSVSVDRFGTIISIDIPGDFTYSENLQKNEIEITLENCRIQFQGYDYIRIPSFSPLFESIEVSSLSDSNSSILKIKLVDPNLRPVISVSPSLNRMVFSFKSSHLTAKEDTEPVTLLEGFPRSEYTSALEKVSSDIISQEGVETDIDENALIINVPSKIPSPVEVEIPVPIIEIPKVIEEPVEVDKDENTDIIEDQPPLSQFTKDENPVLVIEIPKTPEESDKDYMVEMIVEDVETDDPVIIEPDTATETVEQPESELIPIVNEFPEAILEAIHYSQGGINKDVITIEFANISPTVSYEINESGFVIITMYNLETPPEILPSDHLKREVNGTNIKSLSLTRFTEMGLPALQIKLIGRENIDIDIEEMEGMIEIILQTGEE